MSASVFARVIRNRLRSIPIGIDLTLPDPTDANSRLVVDQVIVGDSTIVRREKAVSYDVNGTPTVSDAATQHVWTLSPSSLHDFTVPYLQIKQQMIIQLVRESDLALKGPAPSPPTYSITVFPIFNVALNATNQTQGGGPLTLSYTLAPVEIVLPDPQLQAVVNAQIAQIVAGFQIPPSTVNLSAMTGLLNRPVNAINAGIACDPAGTRVALRADFDIDASPVAVGKEFFEAGPADLLAGKDWAMLVDANLLINESETKVKKALGDQAGMRILSDPEGSWDAAATTLRIAAAVRLLGVCPGFVDDIDMDVALDLGAHFSVTPEANTFDKPDHLVTHYQLDKSLIDSDQVFGCALTGALLYPLAGTALFATGKISLLQYLGGIGFGPFFTFGQLVGVINGQQLEKDISSSLGDTCHKINDSEYECTSAIVLKIQLVPTLNSRFLLEWAHGVPEGLILSGTISNLGEIFLGSIGDIDVKPFKWQVLGHCTGNGKNNFHVGNEAKIFVGYTPPAKVMSARILSDKQNGYNLTVNDNEITITPANPPVSYGCQVRIITNRGVRTITIPPAKLLGKSEAEALKTALLGANLSCYYWEKIFTPKEKIAWRVDPAYTVERDHGLEHWHILVKNANPESILKISAPNGANIMTLRPSRNGSFHASLNFAGAEAPRELTLELDRAHGETAEPLEVAIHQTLYALRTTLPVQGEVRGVKIAGSLRRPRLSVTTQRHVESWEVANPLAPHLRESVALPTQVDEQDFESLARHVCHTGRELGIAITPTMLLALERLFAEHGHPDSVGAPRVVGVTETLYVRTKASTRVYDISNPEKPREIHTLVEPGWYEQTASGLNLMARYNRESQTIDLYEAAGRHTVTRALPQHK